MVGKYVRYGWLVTRVIAWQGFFLACCLVSAECREIRRELDEQGECIDPLKPLLEELDDLEPELFLLDD